MKKTILSLLCLLSVGVSTSWAGTFYINNLADLVMFRDYVYSGEKNYAGDTIFVTADIDATATVWAYGVGLLQDPTDDAVPDDDSSLNPFKGIFDGQGFTIRGLKIVSENKQQAGLFQCIEGATIKNLNLEDCTISGKGHRVAAIVARAFPDADKDNIIQNCNVINSTITCSASETADFSLIGGIAGTVNKTKIIGCAVNNCTINGTTRGDGATPYCNGAGGIVGRLNGVCSVLNCTVFGGTKVYGKAIGVGAIIGEFDNTTDKSVGSNTYSNDVEVRYYDWTNTRWLKVTNGGVYKLNNDLVDGTKSCRGFNVPDALGTSEYAGITRASEDISAATIYLLNGSTEQRWATYNGYQQTPSTIVVKIGSKTLDSSTEYTVTYDELILPGVYPHGIKITGKGTYFGYVYADFTICKSIDPTKASAVVNITTDPATPNATDLLPARTWTGSELPSAFNVYDFGEELIQGVDYKLWYKPEGASDYSLTAPTGSETAVTKVTVKIEGIGIYSEEFLRDYYIVPVTMTDVTTGADTKIQYGLIDKTNNVNVKGYTGTTDGTDVIVPATMKPIDALTFNVTGVEALKATVINSVTLPSTITSITDGAFDGATNLHWIDASEATGFVPTTLSRTATAAPFKGINKRSLIFLNGSTVEGENYVYKVAVDNYQCDVLKIYDDINGDQQGFDDATAAKWGFQNPIKFDANTVTNTRMLKATVSGKQQGYTICLPYEMPQSNKFKAYQLYYSKGATTIGSESFDGVVGFEEYTDPIPAKGQLVIIPSESGQILSTTGAKVAQTYDKALTTPSKYINYTSVITSSAKSGEQKFDMLGTMEYLAGTTDMYIMQKDNVWNKCKATDYPEPCVLPMRAYIKATASPSRLYTVFTNADGSTTAIEGLQIDANDKAEVYDLQGRKVSAPQRNGLYIVNGKKTIVK